MIEKITYIAFDGEEFESKEDCIAHEENFGKMSEFVQLLDRNFLPVEWTPDNYDCMWNHIYYIVIEPHREAEVEEWWDNTFYTALGVSPFSDLERDWLDWLKTSHGDKPTILAYAFNDDDDWVILNEIYSKANKIAKGLGIL